MTKRNQNFEMWTGDTKRLNVRVVDKHGQPINLAAGGSFNLKWSLRIHADSAGTAIIAKTLAAGIAVIGAAANGQCRITIDPGDSDTELSELDYYHELEMTDTGGVISTLFTGTAHVHKSGAP